MGIGMLRMLGQTVTDHQPKLTIRLLAHQKRPYLYTHHTHIHAVPMGNMRGRYIMDGLGAILEHGPGATLDCKPDALAAFNKELGEVIGQTVFQADCGARCVLLCCTACCTVCGIIFPYGGAASASFWLRI